MDQQFLNVYIENLGKRLTDLVKNEVLLSTQLDLAKQLIESLTKEKESILSQYNEAVAKIDSLQSRKKKEVPTSE